MRAAVPLEAGPRLLAPALLHQPVGGLPAPPHGQGEQQGAAGADPAGGPPVKQEAEEVHLHTWIDKQILYR